MATLDEIKGWSAYYLAGSDLADCATPDTLHSAGADFLVSVRNNVVEGIEDGRWDPEDDSRDNDNGEVHAIADDAPDVYTHRLWSEFLDLAAYNEEPESGEWPDDLSKVAGVALYQIAERLVYGILREWREGVADATDDPDNAEDDADVQAIIDPA